MRRKNGLAKKLVAAALVLSLAAGGAIVKKTGFMSKADSESPNAASVASMLLNEEDFANEMVKARKLTEGNKKVYSFKGVKDLDIYCESHKVDNPKATIVMVVTFLVKRNY